MEARTTTSDSDPGVGDIGSSCGPRQTRSLRRNSKIEVDPLDHHNSRGLTRCYYDNAPTTLEDISTTSWRTSIIGLGLLANEIEYIAALADADTLPTYRLTSRKHGVHTAKAKTARSIRNTRSPNTKPERLATALRAAVGALADWLPCY